MRIVHVVAAALALTRLAGAPAEAFRYVEVGAPVPAATLLDADGHRVTVLRPGQPAIIVFCRADHPLSEAALSDVAALARDRRVDVVAIAAAGTDAARACGRSGVPVLVDRDGRAAEAWGVIVYPSTAVVAGDGRLLYYLPSRSAGYRTLVESQLLRARGEISDAELTRRLAQAGDTAAGVAQQADAAYRRGVEALRARRFDVAARELTDALALAPDHLDARLRLGYARLDMGDAAGAQREFEAVLARRPEVPAARVGAGIARVRLGDAREGIRLLEEAVELNPEPVRGHWELGRAYETLGEHARAVEHYRWAYLKLLQGRK